MKNLLSLLLAFGLLWPNGFAHATARKATMPPPLRPTATAWSMADFDTLAYLAGAKAAYTLRSQADILGISPELQPTAMAAFRQYFKEHSDARRLAYNSGLISVPPIISMFTTAEQYTLGQDTTRRLSLPHFAQGIEEAQQANSPLPIPDNELETWVDGQMQLLKNSYSSTRAEEVSYALGRTAVKVGYINKLISKMGADTLHIDAILQGISAGLRDTQPRHIAHYMGMTLGAQGWQSFEMLQRFLEAPQLSPQHYLEGFTAAYQGQLRPMPTDTATLSPTAVSTHFFSRLTAFYRWRYNELLADATHTWDSLHDDTTLTWHNDSVAYRIDLRGTGSTPTPNQRITATLTPLDANGQAIAPDTMALAYQAALKNKRLNTLPSPLGSILSQLPTGSSITLYLYHHSEMPPAIDATTANHIAAKLPTFISRYRITTTAKPATSSTTAKRATTTRKPAAKRTTKRARRR